MFQNRRLHEILQTFPRLFGFISRPALPLSWESILHGVEQNSAFVSFIVGAMSFARAPSR
jgi:hypothetical protein